MKLIVTVDTEEDYWGHYSATNNPVENIERIGSLQKLFDAFEVRPTYLVTYPVATNARAVKILRGILEEGKCEIGAHCHPWNTPPLNGRATVSKPETMLCNLPEPLVHEKLTVLHETIFRNFGVFAVSFRAGRWGFGPAVAQSLHRLGYRVDSSVTPFMNWRANHGPDYSRLMPGLFRFNSGGLQDKSETGNLLETPVSIGFLQPCFEICRHIMTNLERHPLPKTHVAGILARLGLLNKIWLSPEMTGSRNMIRLARRMKKGGYSVLNMTFHSSSLKVGLSPFVRLHGDELKFFERIKSFVSLVRTAGWKSHTLSELVRDSKKHP